MPRLWWATEKAKDNANARMDEKMTLTERLLALWDHLGIARAHVATSMSGDVAGLAAAAPGRIASLTLCVPSRLDPAPFAAVAARMLTIAGTQGMAAAVTSRAEARLPGSVRVVLRDYDAPGWADAVSDRTEEIVGAMTGFLSRFQASVPAQQQGTFEGIGYRMSGTGPALVLMPFFLAPTQWEAAIPALSKEFTVIVLGGRHLGGVAALEDRALAPSYRGMVRTLLDTMAPEAGEKILDVGCGSGALDRMLAERYGSANPITATDLNPFLLREAAVLASEDGVIGMIDFRQANAEALPFPDASFGCAFTVTVLEECDADLALRELLRVVRPGGRVGVIVRAVDMPQWWHLDLPEPLRASVEIPPQSVGAKGVADASLYRRMKAAGFGTVTCFPSLVTLDRPDGPIWRYREDHVLSGLSPEDTGIWHAATGATRADGLLFMAHPMHCAVGTKNAAR